MVRAEVKIGAPQKKILDHKIFFQTLGQKLRPRSFKWRPRFALFQGGGVQTVVFWSNLRPCYYAITGRGPAGPPPCYGPVLVYFNTIFETLY